MMKVLHTLSICTFKTIQKKLIEDLKFYWMKFNVKSIEGERNLKITMTRRVVSELIYLIIDSSHF